MTVRRVVLVVFLTILWNLAWRDFSVANVLGGVAAAVLVLRVVDIERGDRRPVRHRVNPLGVISFLGFFAYKLVESNLYLAREVVTPTNSIETGIIAVRLEGCSDLVSTIVGNAVSLTPGTLTLEIRRDGETPVLFVHVLHLHDLEEARADVLALMQRAKDMLPLKEAVT